MMTKEERFQARLEQLEAGLPLEECLAGLSGEEAELLMLVAQLEAMPYPERIPEIAAAQRAQVMRQARERKANKKGTPREWISNLRDSLVDQLQPGRILAVATAVVLVGAIVLVAVLQTLPGAGGDAEATPGMSPPAAVDAAQPTPSAAAAAASNPFSVLLPLVGPPLRGPNWASLGELRGLVEVQQAQGEWGEAREGTWVTAGQRIRTGSLSSVLVTFFDGSVARLGPESELTVDALDARAGDGPREIVLTQGRGETTHAVVPVAAQGSRYEVRTSAATAIAKGTVFEVRVAANQAMQLSVDEGVVAVVGQASSVDVVAGQAVTVNAGEPPAEPAFRISGEGQVSQIGEVWVIAGQTFATHAGTVVRGDPQVGDWVLVEGRLLADDTRLADRIVLLQPAIRGRFELTGPVGAMGGTEWTVAGQSIGVDEDTFVEEGVQVGDIVRVKGRILENGDLLADEIQRVEDSSRLPFEFVGVVQAMGDSTWRISGVEIAVDAETEIEGGVETGDLVKVEGWILTDGRWLAREIKRVQEGLSKFEFSGVVEQVDPWVVTGISFETRAWTEIDLDISVGDRVRVEGRILEDGTWVASEIRLLPEDENLTIVFVGKVDGTDPWVVNGIPLETDEQTAVDAGIQVDDLVRVTATILPDGTWLALKIELVAVEQPGEGCVTITAVVTGVGPDWMELLDGPVVDLTGVPVDGDLQVGSVILMQVCVDAEGNIAVQQVIVIYQPQPEVPPAPPPAEQQGEKVTVCHKPNGKNPHSITIARSALPAHLAHGDKLGPCD